jgi:quercetin 2,3-dioxygenase
MKDRTLQRVIRAVDTSDGAGVRLRRSLGQGPHARLDPFLMLDEFATDNPDDYIAGFPPHPHRGFETVTYMLEGHMLHEDHLGNRGHLESGGAQWMTAGRGIIHSEMPQQDQGRMHGFQLWINLPAREKLRPAAYRDITAAEIPEASLPGGAHIRLLAGTLSLDDGPLTGPVAGVTTDPLFLDVALPPGGSFDVATAPDHHAFVYVFQGQVSVGAGEAAQSVASHEAGVLSAGERVHLAGGNDPARLLLLAARPLGEPVVQYGPFVMTSREEIEQALADYQAGRLTG